MNKAGCIEVELPTLQPQEIWKKSNRLDKYVDDEVEIVTPKGKVTYYINDILYV